MVGKSEDIYVILFWFILFGIDGAVGAGYE